RGSDRGPLRPAGRNHPPSVPAAGGRIAGYKHPVRRIQDRPGHRRPDKPPDRTTPVDRHRPPGPGITLKKHTQASLKPTTAIPADPPAIYTAMTTSHQNMRALTTTHYFASSFQPSSTPVASQVAGPAGPRRASPVGR